MEDLEKRIEKLEEEMKILVEFQKPTYSRGSIPLRETEVWQTSELLLTTG